MGWAMPPPPPLSGGGGGLGAGLAFGALSGAGLAAGFCRCFTTRSAAALDEPPDRGAVGVPGSVDPGLPASVPVVGDLGVAEDFEVAERGAPGSSLPADSSGVGVIASGAGVAADFAGGTGRAAAPSSFAGVFLSAGDRPVGGAGAAEGPLAPPMSPVGLSSPRPAAGGAGDAFEVAFRLSVVSSLSVVDFSVGPSVAFSAGGCTVEGGAVVSGLAGCRAAGGDGVGAGVAAGAGSAVALA